MHNPPLDALLQALTASGEARLLELALDHCADADDAGRVLDAADGLGVGALDGALRARLASAAAEYQLWPRALAMADGVDAALDVEVRALLALDRANEAQVRFLAAVAANPTLEQPVLRREIDAALAGTGAETNVLAFNRIGTAPSAGPVGADEHRLARLGYSESTGITFADVGGHAEVKKQIARRIIAPFQKPSLFARFRRKAGGGVLLYGPPGCGKTLVARATAGECQARFINVPATDIMDKYIGEPERKLAAIFGEARAETPTVLFFDEIEALAGKRGHRSHQHEIGLVSTFLAELDGFEQNNEGVLILAATNVPWAVDAAFRRSGRFDRMLFVPPPDREARAEILRLQLSGRPVDAKLVPNDIAGLTSGFSGADLENLVNTAADFAIEESLGGGEELPIARRHFDEALGEVKATTVEWLTTARNFAKYGNTGGQYEEIAEFLRKHGK